MPYAYAPLLKQLLPTIEQAVAALTLADQIDDVARDVRPLMYMLAKMPKAQPRLGGHIRKRRVKVASFDWSITAHDKADLDRAAAAQLRCSRIIKKLMQWHTDRPMHGIRNVSLNWIPGGAYGTTPQIVKRYRPYELEQNGDDILNAAILADQDTIARTYLRDLPRQTFIASCDDSDFRGGVLRSLLFHTILLDENGREWGTYNRKLKGVVQAQHKPWASNADKLAAAQALRGITKNNWALTSDAINFVYSKVAEAAGSNSFRDLRADLALDMAIAVLGEANVSALPSSGGSRAAVEVQERGTDEVGFDDLTCLEDDINDQLLLFDFQINVSPTAQLGDVPWQWGITETEVLDAEKEIAVVNEAKSAGVPLSRAEVYRRIGYPMPAPGEDVFDWSVPT
ncbi:MAG TPA: DUF935 family protein [Candidatus Kapabacteria bacterium]|nr:DUF935 family protein [Candidatus Kapabacteria bacterium]